MPSSKFLSNGTSGLVFKISDSTVLKAPYSTLTQSDILIEKTIYERLGSHPYITQFIEERNGALVLEFLQYPLRKRLEDLFKEGKPPPPERVVVWARQVTEALGYVHSCGVKQVDIGGHNVLLDWNDNAKLCDFAGASIDGSSPSIYPGTRFFKPGMKLPSIEAEIFALGSLIYEIETTKPPYHDKDDREVEALFNRQAFPDTSHLVLRAVIQRCWEGKYSDMSEVLSHIEQSVHHERGILNLLWNFK
jgi:serine/threonine protein kinase